MSYKKPVIKHNKLVINKSTQGEPIELKIERMLAGKEPITNGAPLLHTERKDGVLPATDIRTDRWEVAVAGADKITKSYTARRDNNQKIKKETDKPIGEAEPIQGTQQSSTK